VYTYTRKEIWIKRIVNMILAIAVVTGTIIYTIHRHNQMGSTFKHLAGRIYPFWLIALTITGIFLFRALRKYDKVFKPDIQYSFGQNLKCLFGSHIYDGCVCPCCGTSRHQWKNGQCTKCGKVCHHHNCFAIHTSHYEPDYDSAGRPVEQVTVTTYQCKDCGTVFEEESGGGT
jgi:rubredoxin